MNRYSVKHHGSELATFVRHADALKYATDLSQSNQTTCIVVDNGGKDPPLVFTHGKVNLRLSQEAIDKDRLT